MGGDLRKKDTNGKKSHKCHQTRYAGFNQINFPELFFTVMTQLPMLLLLYYCLILYLKNNLK